MKFTDFTPIITTIVSLYGSYVIAKLTTKREFKKLTLQQKHEIRLNANKAFAKMKSAVNTYTATPIPKYKREALAAVGEFAPYVSEKTSSTYSLLESSLKAERSTSVADFMERLSSEWLSEQPTQEDN